MKNAHYINGQWIVGHGTEFNSINPVNNCSIWDGRHATSSEVCAAVGAAKQALEDWSLLEVTQRINHLEQFSKHIEAKKSELAYLISLETGKPRWEAITEVSSVIAKVALSIRAYQERTSEKKIQNTEADAYLRYKPQGVIAVIGPFNFPAHLSNGHIVPALLAGNTIVYKPSELTPAVAEFMVQCWHDSGLPPGVLNLIQGGVNPSKSLLAQSINGVYFTGSYKTGVLIHQQFSDRPEVILALEMGGNNPLVIDTVTDIDAAVYHTLLSTIITAGQRCTCARRVMIPNNKFGNIFLQRFIHACKQVRVGGFTDNPEPFMGPVIRHSHALAHLAAAKTLLTAGGYTLLEMELLKDNSGLLSPGIIDMTDVNNPLDEELFAPLVQIYRYNTFDEALNIANNTQYGLSAGLMSDSAHNYQLFYKTVNAGLINWNRPTTGASSALPFGGIGRSGNHRPSAYFAADYCAYPIASMEQDTISMPDKMLPGIEPW